MSLKTRYPPSRAIQAGPSVNFRSVASRCTFASAANSFSKAALSTTSKSAAHATYAIAESRGSFTADQDIRFLRHGAQTRSFQHTRLDEAVLHYEDAGESFIPALVRD